ncbi:response regulator [Rhodospirillum sp. A1_3_36]|uniref:response regulator n=1 Tax=Rhodospirillum sp. A1_3_36 TaxID=3391666 RepID=UPI0039A73BA9
MLHPKRDLALIVDDTPGTLGFLCEALETEAFDVLVATDGASALTLTEKVTPDVILMDAVMPGLDGFETCKAMKSRADLAHVPVIFMTGLTETEHVVRALGAGGTDYVTKPIITEELVARIRVHVDNARMTSGVRMALDASGRGLFAVDRNGGILWATSAARRILDSLDDDHSAEIRPSLPPHWRIWMDEQLAANRPEAQRMPLSIDAPALGERCQILLVTELSANEVLLRLDTVESANEARRFQDHLHLTAREAEVVLWATRGKTNRDIADILGLSPRTIDKHLEQAYAKMGVENRAAAIAMALRRTITG